MKFTAGLPRRTLAKSSSIGPSTNSTRTAMIANLMAVSPDTKTVCSHERGGMLQASRIVYRCLVISL
jgi:hypothetical protein